MFSREPQIFTLINFFSINFQKKRRVWVKMGFQKWHILVASIFLDILTINTCKSHEFTHQWYKERGNNTEHLVSLNVGASTENS